MVLLSFTYLVLHSFFLCGGRHQAFINHFMTIHEIFTRRGLAKMRFGLSERERKTKTKIVYKDDLRVLSALPQGYANTEESLGSSVLLISDMSDVAGDALFPAGVKLKAALRLLFTKQTT